MPTCAARLLLAPTLALVLAAPVTRAEEERVEPLMDNSFLLEEAYNQEPGVVQSIVTFTRARGTGAWMAAFTQEWPAPDQRHQLSYTLALADLGGGGGRGLTDVMLNYRYQAAFEEDRYAFAPRLSLIVPSGGDPGAGFRGYGLQVGLPVSTSLAPWLAAHANAGVTWVPSGKTETGHAEHLGYSLGQSFVLMPHPRFNLLLEVLWTGLDSVEGGATRRSQSLTVSPGFRWGLDLPHDVQVVLGLAAPLGVGPSAGDRAVLAYLSVELPFWHPAPEPGEGSK